MASMTSDEAWALTQETFETHRANRSLAAADMKPWIERMIQGYEGRGRSDEAWALTQETFETHRANRSLAARDMQPWIERMIQGYEGRGRSDEAWALTQETFETHRANRSLAARDMQPWIERIIQGYEQRCKYDEELQLLTEISMAYAQRNDISKALEAVAVAKVAWESLSCPQAPPTIPNLQQLVQRLFQLHGFDSQIGLLLEHIRTNIDLMPLEWKMGFLILDIPEQVRGLITSRLKAPKSDVLLSIGGSSKQYQVHKCVLKYWSEYFQIHFSPQWDTTAIQLDETFISTRSLQALIDYMYSGIYEFEDEDDLEEDLQAANYLRILSFKAHIPH